MEAPEVAILNGYTLIFILLYCGVIRWRGTVANLYSENSLMTTQNMENLR